MITIERISNASYGRSRIAGISGTNPELQDPMKPPETPATPTILDNDSDIATFSSNSLRGKLADIQGILRQNSTSHSALQNYRQLLALLLEKREQILEQIKELAKLESKKAEDKAQREALCKKIESFKQQINDLISRSQLDGNKLFTTSGQGTAISLGNNDVINIIPAKNFGVDPTDMDLSEDPNTLLEKENSKIQEIMDYNDFLHEVQKKLGSVTTLMEFKLQDVLDVEKRMTEKNMTMELAKFSLARVLQNMRMALRGQANVSSTAAAVLLINGN